ncbi:MAG: Kdo hydroxylase family protein [Planctomycetes bacterium]|nr:Kdo hydroxylase family protein [Planctomycetota bacterium]
MSGLLRKFSDAATGWLANELSEYTGKWVRDRVSLRTEEEAVRPTHHSRNDLLHVDNFSSRPAGGRRILRLFVNLNPVEPRVWITSEKFEALLARYLRRNRLPNWTPQEWTESLSSLQRLLHRDWSGRPAYDSFMLKLQSMLRADEEFQEKSPKRIWKFPPGSGWLLFADGLSHAVLRGQHAIEHSFFVPISALVKPERAPLNQLIAAGESIPLRMAG